MTMRSLSLHKSTLILCALRVSLCVSPSVSLHPWPLIHCQLPFKSRRPYLRMPYLALLSSSHIPTTSSIWPRDPNLWVLCCLQVNAQTSLRICTIFPYSIAAISCSSSPPFEAECCLTLAVWPKLSAFLGLV
jgi:hypothetical protein